MSKILKSFYLRENVVKIAEELIGKVIVSTINNEQTAGIIVETEAYNGIVDKASHTYGDRRTNRTEVMYQEGGITYVYLCYGIHNLFNIVTNVKEIPHAVLIRAVQPLQGEEIMQKRRNKLKIDYTLTKGPGSFSQALGITREHNALSLSGDKIWVEERTVEFEGNEIIAGPRVGVDYAGEDALLPYRFYVKGNRWVSKPNK